MVLSCYADEEHVFHSGSGGGAPQVMIVPITCRHEVDIVGYDAEAGSCLRGVGVGSS